MKEDKARLPIVENSDIGIVGFCLRTLFEHENDGLAKTLMRRFGGASGVFEASYEELMSVKGMTERTATFFSVVPRLRRQAALRYADGLPVESERDIVRYAAVYFMNDRKPSDVCVCLDKSNRPICAEKLTQTERVREIVSIACGRNADKVLLLRHEPKLREKKRAIYPSAETQRSLIKIVRILHTLGIEFVDYTEYGDCAFFSYASAIDGDIGIKNFDDAEKRPREECDIMRLADIYYEYCIKRSIARNLDICDGE